MILRFGGLDSCRRVLESTLSELASELRSLYSLDPLLRCASFNASNDPTQCRHPLLLH